jgi:uncharacterized protein YggE
MNPRSLTKLLLALAALALFAPAAALAAPERTVSADGEATLRVKNDSAAIGLGVSRERRSRGAALRAVSTGLRRVIAATERMPGIGPGDLTTGRISIRRLEHGKRSTYRASEGIAVTLHEPGRAGDLVSAAVGAGATGVSGPRFFVGDTEAAFRRALAKAFDVAKAKAATLATQAGGALGAAITVDEGGGPEIFPEFAAGKGGPLSDESSAPPVRPGRSTVTASVHVVFELL